MEQFDEFEFDRRNDLGSGAFAIVFKGRYIATPRIPVAIKQVNKKVLCRTKSKDLLAKEIQMMKELSSLKHENLVSLLKWTETDKYVYLVVEYCNGGDLLDYLKPRVTLEEDTIQHFLVHMANGLEAMNRKGIVHRDLKPQNILLCFKSRNPNPNFTEITVKIADFGFARFLNDGVMSATVCGSPSYMAPEVIMAQQYDAKADLWSIGTIIYQCLVGVVPFVERSQELLRTFYERNGELTPRIPRECSDNLRDLLLKLLKKDSRYRISFGDFFNHPFLTTPLMPTPSKRILEEAGPVFKVPGPRTVRRIGGSPCLPRKLSLKEAPKMQESTDFTFLPPRQEPRPVMKIQPPRSSPVKPVPVPSQRLNYLKMVEALKPKAPTPPVIVPVHQEPLSEHPRKITLPEPNPAEIEKLTLPKPNFVICENGNSYRGPDESMKIIDPTPRIPEKSIQDTSESMDVDNANTNPFLQEMFLPFASASPQGQKSTRDFKNTSLDSNLIPDTSMHDQSIDREDVSSDPSKQILAKLQFVSSLTDTLIHVAEQKDNPLASAMASRRQLLTTGTSTTNTSSPYRRAEQLVVYVRALHMLSSALLLAQTNVANHVLHPSPSVQLVLNQLNDKYHQCLIRSQELASLGLPSQDPTLAVISAERIMYRHAIDLCQAAALDELFGNPHLCSQRYQTAYMMLHTLAEQVNCDQDKTVLTSYKIAVQKRLRILERQGYVTAV